MHKWGRGFAGVWKESRREFRQKILSSQKGNAKGKRIRTENSSSSTIPSISLFFTFRKASITQDTRGHNCCYEIPIRLRAVFVLSKNCCNRSSRCRSHTVSLIPWTVTSAVLDPPRRDRGFSAMVTSTSLFEGTALTFSEQNKCLGGLGILSKVVDSGGRITRSATIESQVDDIRAMRPSTRVLG